MSGSSKDPFAEASSLWPHEDPDEINLAAYSATWRWRKKIQPFQDVEFPHISWEMERIGRRLTAHVDADELARREAKRRAEQEERTRNFKLSDELLETIRLMGEQAREAVIAAGAIPDDVATGW